MKGSNSNTYYMAVTNDEYELPLYVSDSLKDMAEKFGVAPNTVASSISHQRGGRVTGRKFLRIEIDECM